MMNRLVLVPVKRRDEGLLSLLNIWDRRIAQGKSEILEGKCSIEEPLLRYGVECYSGCVRRVRQELTPKKVVLLAIRVIWRHLLQEIEKRQKPSLFPKCFHP